MSDVATLRAETLRRLDTEADGAIQRLRDLARDFLIQDGDKCEESQRSCFLSAIDQLERVISGIKPSDVAYDGLNQFEHSEQARLIREGAPNEIVSFLYQITGLPDAEVLRARIEHCLSVGSEDTQALVEFDDWVMAQADQQGNLGILS